MRLTLTTLFLLVLVIPSYAQNHYGKELPIIADFSPNVAEQMHSTWKKSRPEILSGQWAWNSDYGDLKVNDAVFAISDQNGGV